MPKFLSPAIFLTIIILFSSCETETKDNHFISDPVYRKLILTEFEKVKELAKGRNDELFSVFDEELSLEEEEALMFLYAFMPLNDLANENGEFFLSNIKNAFKARELFSWGKKIPEDVYRHFVIPHRINNEDVDSARGYFLKELYPRVKDLDIEEAALEVNHWCHEKVNYQGTNIRTMAPLGVIKTAYGRCGEESTFTTTALRSVGIPARQVYTPRWAHTDDNHAWVEVYINEEWRYLGACEPEPELNIGWFDGPVKRAMMVHTKAYGKYQGDETILEEHDKYSILNLLKNYVPVKDIYVKIIDAKNLPLKDINVEFGLYNYAEYYPLKLSKTNENGLTSLKTGFGDLRILASDSNGNFEVRYITVEKADTIILSLTKKIGTEYNLITDNIPPAKKTLQKLSNEKATENAIRLNTEDSIRNSYIQSFYSPRQSYILGNNLNLNIDKLTYIMNEARGNHNAIKDYLINSGVGYNRDLLLKLPGIIETKDLHDVSKEILTDHLHNYTISSESYPDEIKDNYILNPRILNERLTSYRGFLNSEFSYLKKFDPEVIAQKLVAWCNENILINNNLNYYETALSPVGVYKLKVSDEQSRDMLIVAVMRSIGIPARIETAELKLQYFDESWQTISFLPNEENDQNTKPVITFLNSVESSFEPLYRIHFGLAKWNGEQFITLDYGWEKNINDFELSFDVDPGYYQLTQGNRLQNGSVLVSQSFFSLEENEVHIIPIEMRENSRPLEVLANLNIEENIDDYKIYIFIDPSTEPGKHLINDMNLVGSSFIKGEIPVSFYCSNETDLEKLKAKLKFEFDVNIDAENLKLYSFLKEAKMDTEIELPVIMLINKNKELLFNSNGYNIGTPDQLLKIVDKINTP